MWDEVIGHEENKKFLAQLLVSHQHPHALLFYGPEGIGKSLLARDFAKSLLCLRRSNAETDPCGTCDSCSRLPLRGDCGSHPDFIWVQPDKDSKLQLLKLEQIREILQQAAFGPVLSPYKVCLLDGADAMNQEAANAFLKVLEEPPAGWIFILIASSLNKLLPTILSRVMQIRFQGLQPADTAAILQTQGVTGMEAEILAHLADGSLGRALQYRQQNVLEIRRQVFSYLSAFPVRGPLLFLQRQAYLRGELQAGSKDLLPLIIFCQLLQGILRDAVMIQLGLQEQLFNGDALEQLRQLAARWPAGILQKAVRSAGMAAADLQARIGKKTVLELLTLEINNFWEGRA